MEIEQYFVVLSFKL